MFARLFLFQTFISMVHAHCVLKELPFVGISDHFRQLGNMSHFSYSAFIASFSRVILFNSARLSKIKHEFHCLIPKYTRLSRTSASGRHGDGPAWMKRIADSGLDSATTVDEEETFEGLASNGSSLRVMETCRNGFFLIWKGDMAFFFPMCIFSSVLELPQLQSYSSCSQTVNKWLFPHLPLRLLHRWDWGPLYRTGTWGLWFSITLPLPRNPTAANNDSLPQHAGHFYLGILKYFV